MRKTLVLASLLWLSGAAWAGGAELYAQNCASCHGPGGEGVAGVFPPLAGNPRAADAAYVARVVRNGLSGPLTVGGQTFDGSMPPFTQLSDADVEALAGYVATRLAGAGAAPTPEARPAAAAAGDPEAGRAYFLGNRRFARGGTPCVACHDAPGTGALGGGTLGPDLTGAGARFGSGLARLLERPGFKVMRSLYADRPLTPEEARDVAAFLAAETGAAAPAPSRGWRFAGLGALGTLLLFLVLLPFWPRQRESYRDRLLRRKA